MAKKIGQTAPDKEKEDVYPWLRLLEMEVQPFERSVPRRGKGRPPNPFPRKAIHVTLTDHELEAVDEMARLLSKRLGIHLHRGHVISFMVLYLRSRLQNGDSVVLPEDVNSLSDLAKYLDKMKG
jgi:hypothetical protein